MTTGLDRSFRKAWNAMVQEQCDKSRVWDGVYGCPECGAETRIFERNVHPSGQDRQQAECMKCNWKRWGNDE